MTIDDADKKLEETLAAIEAQSHSALDDVPYSRAMVRAAERPAPAPIVRRSRVMSDEAYARVVEAHRRPSADPDNEKMVDALKQACALLQQLKAENELLRERHALHVQVMESQWQALAIYKQGPRNEVPKV